MLVNEIDNTDKIEEHKRKFHSFLIVCKINNKKIMGFPKRVLLKYYDKDEMINVEFNFHSNRKNMVFNHYISQPKANSETLLIKKLVKFPEKLEILEYSKAPYFDYLRLKYYGFGVINFNSQIVFCDRGDWLNSTPREPDNDFKEFLRNRYCIHIPIIHRQFFQNRVYIQTHCNDHRNTFHIACRQWYSYNNPQF